MNLTTFKKRAADVSPGQGVKEEEQEVIITIDRGPRKKNHYARIKYLMGGSLGFGTGKHYTEIKAEYFDPAVEVEELARMFPK